MTLEDDKVKKENLKLFAGGGVIGLISVFLIAMGNPGNMGICVVCFLRDIGGALGLHRAEMVQYIRPEIIGFILGSFIISLLSGEFKPRGGSAPLLRFIGGAFMSIGALVFLGCPTRLLIRLGSGDLNALVGLLGFGTGIFAGSQFLKRGFFLGSQKDQSRIAGLVMPAFALLLFALLIIKPDFIFSSVEGPGSMRAPILISLVGGAITGLILQKTRICSTGAFRNIFLIKDFSYMWGIIGIVAGVFVGSLVNGSFHLGFESQPIAHTMGLWNFLGMFLVGYVGVLLGGCPVRQTVLAGEGDTDAGLTVFGVILGAALAHNFGLAASGDGVPLNGQVAIIGILVVMTLMALYMIREEIK